jgi:hypothetical protein
VKAALAWAARQGVAAAGFTEPRAWGGGFIGRPWGLGVWAQRVARVEVELVPWLYSGSSPSLATVRDDPDSRGPPGRERRRGEERVASDGLAGPGEEKNEAAVGLGHTVEGEKGKKKN